MSCKLWFLHISVVMRVDANKGVGSEIKEVPENSDEAKKWPLWTPENTAQETPGPSVERGGDDKTSSEPPALSISTVPPAPGAPTQVDPSSSKPKPSKRPGPRKPKVQLAPLPGSQKAKKLTTLDKSAMDWKAHVQTEGSSSGLKDELEANRRGGGYLEKQEFLQRVEQRKEEALEASKSTKRRRL